MAYFLNKKTKQILVALADFYKGRVIKLIIYNQLPGKGLIDQNIADVIYALILIPIRTYYNVRAYRTLGRRHNKYLVSLKTC